MAPGCPPSTRAARGTPARSTAARRQRCWRARSRRWSPGRTCSSRASPTSSWAPCRSRRWSQTRGCSGPGGASRSSRRSCAAAAAPSCARERSACAAVPSTWPPRGPPTRCRATDPERPRRRHSRPQATPRAFTAPRWRSASPAAPASAAGPRWGGSGSPCRSSAARSRLPLQRVAAAADFGNGISSTLDFDEHLFINTDLSLHLVREPVGEWVLLDSRTFIDRLGVGLAQSRLYDLGGVIGLAAQTLYVDRR